MEDPDTRTSPVGDPDAWIVTRTRLTAFSERLTFASPAEPSRVASFAEVSNQLRAGGPFCRLFNAAIAACPFSAFFWETPPTTIQLFDKTPFSMVLTDAPILAGVTADPDAFAIHFSSGENVSSFANLGRDARLVVPAPAKDSDRPLIPHLGAFVRLPAQFADWQTEFWVAVANQHLRELQRDPARPLWLSTSGLGVYWLHVRIDSRPKYYTYQPFKSPP